MTTNELQALLESVRAGAVSPADAREQELQFVRHAPFEDLGFARVDHHRSVRQGFPEAVFGERKTPEQVAAIAERIVAHGHTLLITRTTADAFLAVRQQVPAAVFHDTARL